MNFESKSTTPMGDQLKPCPFCGAAAELKTIADMRSAEFVGPWRQIRCSNETCRIRPQYLLHTDGKWVPGKGTPQGLDRDDELTAVWNARRRDSESDDILVRVINDLTARFEYIVDKVAKGVPPDSPKLQADRTLIARAKSACNR